MVSSSYFKDYYINFTQRIFVQIFIIESTPKTDELHRMEYFGCDLPMRSYIDSAVPRNQYRKGFTAI